MQGWLREVGKPRKARIHISEIGKTLEKSSYDNIPQHFMQENISELWISHDVGYGMRASRLCEDLKGVLPNGKQTLIKDIMRAMNWNLSQPSKNEAYIAFKKCKSYPYLIWGC